MTISGYLEQDHRRIEDLLLRAATSGDRIEAEFYREFRGALLRHIGMEEKILFPAIRNATHGGSLPGVEQLHLDHGALAALLVPSPTRRIIEAIRTILHSHNAIEEGSSGVYAQFEKLPGIGAREMLLRLETAPQPALNPHVDNRTAIASMRAAVLRAGYSLDL